MVFEQKHQDFLNKLHVSLYDLQILDSRAKNRYIAENLLSYICGDGTQEEETIADDIITMMTVWTPGQVED